MAKDDQQPRRFNPAANKLKKLARTEQLKRTVNSLQNFEQFENTILPELRELVTNGASSQEIYKRFEALAAARAISLLAVEQDSGKALAIIKEVIDRTSGKPTEKKEVTHKLGQLSEEELTAKLLTSLNDDAELLEELDGSADEPTEN